MNHRPARTRNARLFLLIAALAHVLGGDLGAWMHRYSGPAAGVTVSAPPSDGERSAVPDHPLDCAVCRTLANGALALPARGIALRAGIQETLALRGTPRLAPRYLAAPPSLPRGPPTHS